MTLGKGTPAIVIFPDQEGDVPAMLMSFGARMDDARWAWSVGLPFSWPQFYAWWVARRWIVPRDIRKE